MPENLATRVRLLVEVKYDGSVNKAAKGCGIPQQTLTKVVSGKTAAPRSPVLLALAAHFEVSVDWLLSGRGKGPIIPEEDPLRTGEAYRWAKLVESLDLPLAIRVELSGFPVATIELSLAFILGYEGQAGRITRETEGMIEAYRAERRAWLRLFEEWIRLQGRPKVRAAVIKHADMFRQRRFGPAPTRVKSKPVRSSSA